MRQTAPLLVKLGKLSTPKEALKSESVHGKANDFFREACAAPRNPTMQSIWRVDPCNWAQKTWGRDRDGLTPPPLFQCRAACVQVVRCLPWVVNNYKLEEITTVPELRNNVAKLFKLHADMRNPAVSSAKLGCCAASTGA